MIAIGDFSRRRLWASLALVGSNFLGEVWVVVRNNPNRNVAGTLLQRARTAGARRSLHFGPQDVEVAGEVRDVVEGLTRDGLGETARLGCVAAEDDDPRVVILHGQAAVVLGLSHLADILAGLHGALRDIARAREGPRVELLSASRVEEHRGPVVLKHMVAGAGFEPATFGL